MYCTYVLYSPSLDSHYIGQTQSLEQRLKAHAEGSTAETAQAHDWQLIFKESFVTRGEAMGLERKIKRARSRQSIRRYVTDARNEIPEPIAQVDW